MDVQQHGDALFVGPPLESGPLPTLIYFSLSAHDSLTLDPFNQPVVHLSDRQARIFSYTIPGHEDGKDPKAAIAFWASEFASRRDPLTPFFDRVATSIEEIQASTSSLLIAGLSRGAFVAAHIAHRISCDGLLGFAPLTTLETTRECEGLDLSHFNLDCLDLTRQPIRLYIGNRDRRVGTEHAFTLITSLAERSHEHSPPFELFITPSIGYQGHGTSPEIFREGAEWAWRHLEEAKS